MQTLCPQGIITVKKPEDLVYGDLVISGTPSSRTYRIAFGAEPSGAPTPVLTNRNYLPIRKKA